MPKKPITKKEKETHLLKCYSLIQDIEYISDDDQINADLKAIKYRLNIAFPSTYQNEKYLLAREFAENAKRLISLVEIGKVSFKEVSTAIRQQIRVCITRYEGNFIGAQTAPHVHKDSK